MKDPGLKKRSAKEMPIGGMITVPGSSASFHTGNWRSRRPVIDDSRCINCLFCTQFCPENCITLDRGGKRGKVNYDYCKGCGICAEECPANCIEMKDESEFREEKCVDECVKDDKKFKI